MEDKTDNQSYYVATSIPYVNAVPHIGFAYELVEADVLARYNRIQGRDVFFSTGADEHGGKIEKAAKAQGVSAQRFVDQNATAVKDVADALDVDYTKFIKTSSAEHETAVAVIWKQLAKFIYKAKYSGMYDTREEAFVTDEEAKRLMTAEPARYDRLEKIEEENYFFKLSAFTDQIKKLIDSNEMQIIPETKKNEIYNLIEGGLQDISISRPADKITWGIAVPGDPEHTIYVWFDALLNYITTLGYPDGADFKKYWPADVHVIGKDIIRFHAAIWPAMLLALGLKTPKFIYVHGFITFDGEKMSKSVGNVVSPLAMISGYGTDATRYYLLRHIPSYGDGDFTWERMEAAYNNELGNELGNLVQRVAVMGRKYLDGVVIKEPETVHDDQPYHQAIEEFRYDRALDHCWVMIRSLNKYIDETKPWEVAKEDLEHLGEIIGYLVTSIRQLATLLEPFMPDTAYRIEDLFKDSKIASQSDQLFPKIENYQPDPNAVY